MRFHKSFTKRENGMAKYVAFQLYKSLTPNVDLRG